MSEITNKDFSILLENETLTGSSPSEKRVLFERVMTAIERFHYIYRTFLIDLNKYYFCKKIIT